MSKYAGRTDSYESFKGDNRTSWADMFDAEDWSPLTKSNRYGFPMSKKRLKRMKRMRRVNRE